MKKISVETIGSIGAFFLLDAGIAYLFYQNWIAFLCFLPFLQDYSSPIDSIRRLLNSFAVL